jgi:hypothetical protein
LPTPLASGFRTCRYLTAALLAWQLRQVAEADAAQDAWQDTGHVFTCEDGSPLDPAYVTRLFQRIRRQGDPP